MSVADVMPDDLDSELAEAQNLVDRATWVDLRTAEFPHDGPTKLDFPVLRFEVTVGP